MTQPLRIAVLGIGNVLIRDDGFGPSLVQLLENEWRFPENVVVEDLGTPGLELSTHMVGHDVVILLDAVAADAPAGTIVRFTRDEIMSLGSPMLRMGPHDPALTETLIALEFLAGVRPDIVLIGAVPRDVSGGLGLSDDVRAALPRAAEMVIGELAALGAQCQRTGASGASSEAWWQHWVEEPEPAAS